MDCREKNENKAFFWKIFVLAFEVLVFEDLAFDLLKFLIFQIFNTF